MHSSFGVLYILCCLASIFGIQGTQAWQATFFSEELGCGDAGALANSTSLEYTGPDLNDTLIPQLMPCLDLGSLIEDPMVNCTARMTLSATGPTGNGDCSEQNGFVGKSVTVTNMLFCLGWENPGCIGKIYYTWTPDLVKQQDGCHPGLRVRSFKCLQ
ncbi:hypothetical protein ONZ43_g5070 [Nemania bipapillata]|uniref:Uncharacterized protein n=1 Tax=Nemania bipapillata TaxID=110536 RepID=A0ACC2IFB8_9PEZI|nr:hypothetical protein ONZ43_g5070 [Nemania bipapillata]